MIDTEKHLIKKDKLSNVELHTRTKDRALLLGSWVQAEPRWRKLGAAPIGSGRKTDPHQQLKHR
jgi:hypothetical protein